MEVSLLNSGNGLARSINISFDNLESRGKTMVDELEIDSEMVLNFEVRSSSRDSVITRMDVFYHAIEGDTFSIIRRDWFPNSNERKTVFLKEIPPGEEDKANLYTRKEVMSDDFQARVPTKFLVTAMVPSATSVLSFSMTEEATILFPKCRYNHL